MIYWMDFKFDEVFGPILEIPEKDHSRKARSGSPSVMEDAEGSKIQETGQKQRPARMVGLSSLDSFAQTDMEVGTGDRTDLRRRGEG